MKVEQKEYFIRKFNIRIVFVYAKFLNLKKSTTILSYF